MITATLSEFAKLEGVRPSYITKLKQSGRLVITDEGLVDVDASRQRIASTADPNRDDVRARHASARTTAPDPTTDMVGQSFQKSRAVKERFLALSAKLDYELRSGSLVETESVKTAAESTGHIIRSMLENLPDQLAPLLAAEPDENRAHALLTEHIEIALTEIAARLAAVGRELIGDKAA